MAVTGLYKTSKTLPSFF